MTDATYPALLRYWRNARGLSQLDLAIAAAVSPKHISFLETGRSRPSQEMALHLATTLGLPFREQNAMLVAAGFAPRFEEVGLSDFGPEIQNALRIMLRKHEPYPMLVFDRAYDIVQTNDGANRLLVAMLGDRAGRERNLMKLLFDPSLLRPLTVDWERVARAMLARLQREALMERRDEALMRLIATLCAYDGVPRDWRAPDFEAQSDATLQFRIQVAGQTIAFLTTVTVFSAPQNVSLQELHIESYFPLDEGTEAFCRALKG